MGHPLRMQSRVQKGEHGSGKAQGKTAANEAFVTKISLSVVCMLQEKIPCYNASQFLA